MKKNYLKLVVTSALFSLVVACAEEDPVVEYVTVVETVT